MVLGKNSTNLPLSPMQVQEVLTSALGALSISNKRVLVLIPDNTRTAPIPMIFSLLYENIGKKVEQLDYLIALGTHPPLSENAIDKLVGYSKKERAIKYPAVNIFNHQWNSPAALETIGVITRDEMDGLTNGLFAEDTIVRLNKIIENYDLLIVCGPVFPHEVVGFSGGAKYLFPGIAGQEIIDTTHWLGALSTSMLTSGVKDTPVRRVINKAVSFVKQPVLCLALCMQSRDLFGIYAGTLNEAWSAAADLSSRLNIIKVPETYHTVLSTPADIYNELWTAAKAMYKTEAVVADGGEVIIFAPHLSEISYSHNASILRIGYHVRDYFLKQWERFSGVPLSILAHSTHVRGSGTYELGIEKPRIQVTLATAIPKEVCHQINLGYRDPKTIDTHDFAGKEKDGILYVPHAGEQLYQVEKSM